MIQRRRRLISTVVHYVKLADMSQRDQGTSYYQQNNYGIIIHKIISSETKKKNANRKTSVKLDSDDELISHNCTFFLRWLLFCFSF